MVFTKSLYLHVHVQGASSALLVNATVFYWYSVVFSELFMCYYRR